MTNEFTDPGLTDSQGQSVTIRYTPTAWGGHILTTKFKQEPTMDYACFDAGAWKESLSIPEALATTRTESTKENLARLCELIATRERKIKNDLQFWVSGKVRVLQSPGP